MRCVLVGFGSQGDIRPLVALGAALRARGHEVTFPADGIFAPLIERNGIAFVPLAGDLRAAMSAVQEELFDRGTRPMTLLRAVVGGASDYAVPWARSYRAAAEGADAVIGGGLGIYAAISLAEAVGAETVFTTPVPIGPTRAFPPTLFPPRPWPGWINHALHLALGGMVWSQMRGPVNRARREVYGLPPLTAAKLARLVREAGWLQLHGYSPALVPPAPDLPPNSLLTGAWELPEGAGWAPPPGLLDFLASGEAPVYVGFGSMGGRDPAAASRLVLEALGGRRAVLATGWGGLSAGLALPAHVFALDEAPHDWLLPRMRLAVHHGGAGTTHAVARAGIPSVVVPFLGDQPFWAWRLREAGVAPPAILRRDLTAPALAAAIAAAEDPAMRARSAGLGGRMRAEGGVAAAVAAIEARLSCR